MVAIHTQPLYSVQSIVVQRLFDTITSLAVPYFFSVSGFLLFSKIDADIYVSEIIYFTHMWVAFGYTLVFREFRYYGADIFFASTLIPIFLYYILYRSHMLDKVKIIL